MAHLWTVTLGFIISLGLLGGIFIHFVRRGLNTEDSKRIDHPDRSNELHNNSSH